MIPLAGSKQEQCAAETSRRGPKISLMFTPSGQQRPEIYSMWGPKVFCTSQGFLVRCFCRSVVLLLLFIWAIWDEFQHSFQWKHPRRYEGKLKELLGILSSKRVLRGLYLLKMHRKKEWVGEEVRRQTDRAAEYYESMNSAAKTSVRKINTGEGLAALAQLRYFPLCAQLDLWDSEQYSPPHSQTLTQAGEI